MSNQVRQMFELRAYPDLMSERQEIDPIRRGLGMRLASARKNKNLTQDQVAEKFSINKATVSAWETGRGVPDALTLRALAKLYDTSADALLWEDSLTPEAMRIAAEFDSLTDKQQRTFRTVFMAYVRDSAGDGEVEDRMEVTKEFKYAKKNEEPPLVKGVPAPEVAKKHGG